MRPEIELSGSISVGDLGGDSAVISARSAHMVKLDFSGADLRGSDFDRVAFDSVNLSRANLTECRFTRCVFRRCDLAGVDLAASHLNQVVFMDCRLSYSNWVEVALHTVAFEGGLLVDSELTRVSCVGVSMTDMDLSRSVFSHLSLPRPGDLDVSGSTIDDTRGLGSVSGLAVDGAQAALIAQALLDERGILVDHEPAPDRQRSRDRALDAVRLFRVGVR